MLHIRNFAHPQVHVMSWLLGFKFAAFNFPHPFLLLSFRGSLELRKWKRGENENSLARIRVIYPGPWKIDDRYQQASQSVIRA